MRIRQVDILPTHISKARCGAPGRFMTPDWDAKATAVPYAAFGDPQTLNLYAYVENGPLNKVDSDGHSSGAVVSQLAAITGEEGWDCSMRSGTGCTGEMVERMYGSGGMGSNGESTVLITATSLAEAEFALIQQAGDKSAAQVKQPSGRNEGDWGHRPMGVSGDLSAPKLLAHYAGGSGTDYHLTAYGFQDFIAEMEKDGRIPTTATPAEGAPGLWVGTVNTYGTPYENAVGFASLYFDSTGHAIGYSDYWNFDHKAAGARPGNGELKTELGSHIPGKPFLVLYGITPPEHLIPEN